MGMKRRFSKSNACTQSANGLSIYIAVTSMYIISYSKMSSGKQQIGMEVWIMAGLYTIALVGVPAVAMVFQYRNYRKSHPKGSEKKCDCPK
jgi:hypothetical protein